MSSFSARPLVAAALSLELPGEKHARPTSINLNSPALSLFTDLTQTPSITVSDSTQIDVAHERMLYAGVRLLFVVDAHRKLVGFVSSYDIAGERPMQLLQSRGGAHGGVQREHLVVRDLMVPVSDWRVLEFSTVERSRVGDIVETFRSAGAWHLVVVDSEQPEHPIVRGLFSLTQFERALGTRIDAQARPSSFADVERALVQPR